MKRIGAVLADTGVINALFDLSEDICRGELAYENYDNEIVSMYGFEDLEFADLNSADDMSIVTEFANAIATQSRGKALAIAMLKDREHILVISEMFPFKAEIQSIKEGEEEVRAYEAHIDVNSVDEEDEDACTIFQLFNMM